MSSTSIIFPSADQAQKCTKRCNVCNKKVNVDYFTCKCNPTLNFCNKHRYPFEHNCNINLITKQQNLLTKLNPKIQGEKFERI